MSSSKQCVAFLVACLAIIQLGCGAGQSSTDKMQARFEEMKLATNELHETLCQVTDVASAEATMPKLEEVRIRLAIAVHELNLAEQTSSRSAMPVRREIADFKKETKSVLKVEFDRLRSDSLIKAALEPFLGKIETF